MSLYVSNEKVGYSPSEFLKKKLSVCKNGMAWHVYWIVKMGKY
jgi:hypothetical protein